METIVGLLQTITSDGQLKLSPSNSNEEATGYKPRGLALSVKARRSLGFAAKERPPASSSGSKVVKC
jgi:hypothetical protein